VHRLPGLGETDHVLDAALRAFQRDILKRGGRPISTLPLWFVEGMAEYLSVGTIDTNTAMWLRGPVEQNLLPLVRQLPPSFPIDGQPCGAIRQIGDDVVPRVEEQGTGAPSGSSSR
jgi:hypothetical protein